MKDFIKAALGFLLLCCFVILKGSYKGCQRFYRIVQSDNDNFLKECAVTLLTKSFGELAINYKYFLENKDKQKLSNLVIKQYSDDSLFGYGDENFSKGGDNIETQQRGLILPTLTEYLGNCENKKVVEIGTGNGDVIALLSRKFPSHHFLGVDFSVKTAEKKHSSIPNLHFQQGYPLDILKNGDLIGDILFSSSTFILFNPPEIKEYFKEIKKAGFSSIFLNEPVWSDHLQRNNSEIISKHLEGACWYHNYCGYLREAGFEVTNFSFFHYKHPVSLRPDIFVLVVGAKS